jgi:magnesium-transporting ATPase (P-type)
MTFVKKLFTYLLMCTNLVPISLPVTVEFCKLFQGIFIGWDMDMTSLEYNEEGELVAAYSANA